MKNNSKKSSVAPKKSAVCSLQPVACPPRSSVFSLQSSVSKLAFTLLELLIVIALIMVLAGLLIPAFYKVQNAAKAKRAQIEARVIGSAIQTYKLQEKKFPAPTGDLGGGSDQTYGVGSHDNSEVMSILRAAQPPVLDANKLRWDGDGNNANVLNPDGNQYRITLDLDYDGEIWVDFNENGQVDNGEILNSEYHVR